MVSKKAKKLHNVSQHQDSGSQDDSSQANDNEHIEEIDTGSDGSGMFSKMIDFFAGNSDKKVYDKLDRSYSIALKIAPILIVLSLVLLGGYIRATPAHLPITDDWAQETINNQLRQQITPQVRQEYPNLPPENLRSMVNEQINEFIDNNREMYEQQVEEASDFLRSQMQTEDGTTYLTGIDSYHWYRLTRNVLRRGGPGDDYIDGRGEVDRLMFYPRGLGDTARRVDTESLIYIGAYSHTMMSSFMPDLSLMKTAFYFTIIFASLGVIPAFFIAKKFAGIAGGTIAGFIMAIHPSLLSRSMGGFYDTDFLNVILPLFIVWFLIEALYAKKVHHTIMYSALALIFMIFFAFSWQGWWYIFLIVAIAMLGYLVWLFSLNVVKRDGKMSSLIKTRENKRKIIGLGSFAGGSFLLIGLTMGFDTIIKIFYEYPMNVLSLQAADRSGIWPNVMTTVAELNPSAHSDIVGSFGGPLLFSLAFIGCVIALTVWKSEHKWKEIGCVAASTLYYQIILASPDQFGFFMFPFLLVLPILGKVVFNLIQYPAKDLKDIRVPYAAIISIWLVSMVLASTRGVRFIIMILPAFALGFGIFMGTLSSKLSDFMSKTSGFNKKTVGFVVGLLVVSLFFIQSADDGFLDDSTETARNYLPQMNDAWYQGLQGINETADQDAVIGSWWDFGHWFKAIAERPVFFDGGSQNTNTAHWMGKSLVTEDEKLTAGLLRKMSCGRDEAYDYLNDDAGIGGPKSVDLLDEIVVTNKDDAMDILLDAGVPEDIAVNVTEHTHCEPPEVYYITSEDMVGKGGVWGHFGSWDFYKAEQYQRVKDSNDSGEAQDFLMEDYDYDENEATKIYNEIMTQDPDQWIAPWPGYVSAGTPCQDQGGDVHQCRIDIQGQRLNVAFNSSAGEAFILNPTQQQGVDQVPPAALSYYDEDGRGFVKKEYDSPLPYGLSFVKNGGSYAVVMMEPTQTASMFTRLFFHDGAGTNYFDKVYDERGVPGGRVMIWRVDWDAFFDDIDEDIEGFEFDEAEDIDSPSDAPGVQMPAGEQQPQQVPVQMQ